MKEIVQADHPVLRQPAVPVGLDQIERPETKALVSEMKKVLAAAEDGLALAAPQIGVPLRIFIVSGKLFGPADEVGPDLVCINPVLTKLSRRKIKVEEGCLSVRFKYGEVRRAERATLTAYDERGRRFTRHGSGLVAQIFQHESDHLNGILFTDTATNVHEVKPENN